VRSKNRSARPQNSPRKASRLKHDPDKLLHVGGINYVVSCSRTYDNGSWKAPVCHFILSAAGEIAARQIGDDLRAPIGQNAFAAVGNAGGLAVPQESNP